MDNPESACVEMGGRERAYNMYKGENPKIVLKRLQMGQCQEISEVVTYEINPIRHNMHNGRRQGRKSRGGSQRELEKGCEDT